MSRIEAMPGNRVGLVVELLLVRVLGCANLLLGIGSSSR